MCARCLKSEICIEDGDLPTGWRVVAVGGECFQVCFPCSDAVIAQMASETVLKTHLDSYIRDIINSLGGDNA